MRNQLHISKLNGGTGEAYLPGCILGVQCGEHRAVITDVFYSKVRIENDKVLNKITLNMETLHGLKIGEMFMLDDIYTGALLNSIGYTWDNLKEMHIDSLIGKEVILTYVEDYIHDIDVKLAEIRGVDCEI